MHHNVKLFRKESNSDISLIREYHLAEDALFLTKLLIQSNAMVFVDKANLL